MATGELPSFGSLLRHLRLVNGLTQEGLAERSGLSVRAISDLERGTRRTPRLDTLEMLAQALALSPQERGTLAASARGWDRSPTVGLGASPSSTAGAVVGRHPPLVGRLTEVALLDRHLGFQGPPLLVFAGEPGIGKSRLLLEASVRAADHGLAVLAGGCSQREGQEPFVPILEALERHIRAQDVGWLRSLLRGCAWLVRLLPELADGPVEGLPPWDVTVTQERRLMFRAVAQYLANVAGPIGTLLLLDDLQWAGADALDLLRMLVRAAADAPFRIVGAYRDTEVDPADPLAVMLGSLARGGMVAHHELPPLADDDAALLLDALLTDAPADHLELQRGILQRAEGVPFYVVSLADALQQGGGDGAAPWNVAQSVRQRVAALPAVAQTMLSTASVIGRRVEPSLLAAVVGVPDEAVIGALDAACRSRLLEEVDGNAYRFTHDVIREVLEAGLTAVRRAALHRRVATHLERRGSKNGLGSELPVELLAFHYGRSGDQERAIEYFDRAAERARRASAHRDEAALLGHAIALTEQLGRDETLADLRARRGRACFDVGLWTESRADLEAALGRLPLAQRERRCRVLIDLAMVCHWLSDADSTRRYGSEALALAETLADSQLVAEAICALSFADSSDGDLRSSLEGYKRATKLATPRQEARLVHAAEMSSLILYWLGDFEQSLAKGRHSLAVASEVGDVTHVARSLGNVGMALTGAGRYAEAKATFAEGRRYSQAHELGQWLARTISMESGLHLVVYDFAGAEAHAEEALERGRSLNWLHAVVSAQIDLLQNLARRGEVGDRVDVLLREASESSRAATGAHGWLWRLRLAETRAEIAVARGTWHDARVWATDAIRQARRRGRPKYEVLGLVARGSAARALGRREAAADLRAAVDLANRVGDPALVLHASRALVAADGDDALAADVRAVTDHMAEALPEAELHRRFLAAASTPFRLN